MFLILTIDQVLLHALCVITQENPQDRYHDYTYFADEETKIHEKLSIFPHVTKIGKVD